MRYIDDLHFLNCMKGEKRRYNGNFRQR